jgi:hypothetical protein
MGIAAKRYEYMIVDPFIRVYVRSAASRDALPKEYGA